MYKTRTRARYWSILSYYAQLWINLSPDQDLMWPSHPRLRVPVTTLLVTGQLENVQEH